MSSAPKAEEHVGCRAGDEFCVDALTEALEKHGRSVVFNTDQGSTFTANAFAQVLARRRGEDQHGRPVEDNVFIERL